MFNKNSGYGLLTAIMMRNEVTSYGKVFVVCPDADANAQKLKEIFEADIQGEVRFFSTLDLAYAATVSNRNDVILLTSNSSHTLSAGLLFAKSRVMVIGMDGGDRLTDQGTKIQVTGSTDTTGYVMKVTGTRNTFRNIKFIQGCTNAAALTVVQDSGEGSVYKNCSFIFGVANNLGGTTAQEFIASCDSASFINCEFGADTLLTSGARAVLLAKTDATEMKSNRFKECTFKISSSSSTATFIRLNAITDILFTNLFERCSFIASVDTAGGAAIAECVQTGTGTNKGTLSFAYPAAFNVSAFAVATGGRNAAVQVVAPTSVATTFKGITPTA